MVTLNFTAMDSHPSVVSALFRKLLSQRFAPWLRRTAKVRTKTEPTYVWALEAAGGQLAVHWLVLIPSEIRAAFEEKLGSWTNEISGGEADETAVDVRPISNLLGARKYILKGTEPNYAALLKINHVNQGEVIGKRAGASKNLSHFQRRKAGYRPKRWAPIPIRPTI